MTVAFWLKLILLCAEGVRNAVTWQSQRDHQKKVAQIKRDPVGAWNARFGRMREHRTPASAADATGVTGGIVAGDMAGTERHGAADAVFRAGGSPLPVMQAVLSDHEKALMKETSFFIPLPAPRRSSNGAAGYDLPSAVDAEILPGAQVLIPTGWCVAIPAGNCGVIHPRSGWAVKRCIDKRAGLIDEDYRGEVQVLLRNESTQTQSIKRGDRIAQMVIQPYTTVDVVTANKFEDTTDRGSGGFGSTGGMSNG